MKLEFKDSSEKPVAYFGGAPWLETKEEWPLCPQTGKPMLHLVSVLSDMIGDPFDAGYAVSVFVSRDFSSKYTIHSNSELTLLKAGFSKVILTKRAASPLAPEEDIPLLPFKYLEKRPFTPEENEEEQTLFDETGMGLDTTKLMGVPFYEQDKIFPGPKYFFFLQFNEWEIDDIAPDFKGLFQLGLGYVFLNQNYKRLKPGDDAGLFFIQHT